MKSATAIAITLIAGLAASAAHAAPTGIISARYEQIIGAEAGSLLAKHFGVKGSNMVVGIMLSKAAKFGLIEATGSKYCPTFSFKAGTDVAKIQTIFTAAADMKKNKCENCRLFAGYKGPDKVKSAFCTGNRCPQEAILFSLERAIRQAGISVPKLGVQEVGGEHAGHDAAGTPTGGG